MEKKRKHVQSASPSSKKLISQDHTLAVMEEEEEDDDVLQQSNNDSDHVHDVNEENGLKDDQDFEDVIEEEEEQQEEEEEEEQEEELLEEKKKADEEPLEKVMENFNRDLLVSLITEFAEKHTEIGDRVREQADKAISSRKIFVFGIGPDSNTAILTNAFKQYGRILQCKAVRDRASKKSKGYGFVVFSSRKEALHALTTPFKMIGNRVASCRLAASSQISQTRNSNQSRFERKIHIGNLTSKIDPVLLATHFSQFGEIEEGPLGLSKDGRLKSFCFIIYKTLVGANKALKKSRRKFHGRVLHCERAVGSSKSGLPVRHGYTRSPPPPPPPQALARYVPVHRSADVRFGGSAYSPGSSYVREHPLMGREVMPVRGGRSLYEFDHARSAAIAQRSHGGGYRQDDSFYYGRY